MPITDWSSESTAAKSSAKKTKTSGPAYTEKQLVRLAARLGQRSKTGGGTADSSLQNKLLKTFQGYSAQKVRRIEEKANVPELSRVSNRLEEHRSKEQLPGEGFLGGGLGTVLWALNRPGQAVLGGVAEGGSGVLKGFTDKEAYTPVQSFARGVLGQSKQQAQKTEKNLGWAATPINIVGQAATDPLTYLTFGTSAAGQQAAQRASEITGVAASDIAKQGIKALTKQQAEAVAEAGGQRLLRYVKGAPGGVKVAGRTVVNTKGVGERLKPLSEKFWQSKAGKVAGTAESAVVPRASIKQAARRGEDWATGVAGKLENATARLEGAQGAADREFVSKVQNILRSNRVGSKEDLAVIRRALDVDPPAGVLTAGQQGAVKDFRRLLDEVIGNERGQGIATPYLGQGSVKALERQIEARSENPILNAIKKMKDPTIDDPLLLKAQQREAELARQYFPHQLTKEGYDYYGRNPQQFGSPSVFSSTEPGFTKFRKVPGSVEDINTRIGKPAYETNPVKAIVGRGLQSNRNVARRQFMDELAGLTDEAGQPVLMTERQWDSLGIRRPRDMTPVKLPSTFGEPDVTVMVHPEIASSVKRVSAVLSNDAATTAAKNAWDRYLQLWKGYAVATPGFSLRNMTGNWFNASWLPESGVRTTLRDYAKAFKLQTQIARGYRKGNPLAFLSSADAAAVKNAMDLGVLDEGFFSSSADLVAGKAAKSRLRDASAGEVAKRGLRRANPLSTDNAYVATMRAGNRAVESNARLAMFLRNEKTLGPEGAAAIVRKYLFDYNDLTPFEQNVVKRVAPFYTWSRKNVPLQLETLWKQPSRFSRIGQAYNEISRQQGPVETTPVPLWMRQDQLPIKLGSGEGNESLLIPDLPVTQAAQFLDQPPQDTLLQQLGGPAGVLKSLVEFKARKNLFTGQEYKPGQRQESPLYAKLFGKTIDPALQNLLEQALPALSKIRTLAPRGEYDIGNQDRRLLSLLGGINVWELNDKTKNSELYRRLAELQATERTVESTSGKAIPKLTDLKGYKRPASKSSSSGVTDWSKG